MNGKAKMLCVRNITTFFTHLNLSRSAWPLACVDSPSEEIRKLFLLLLIRIFNMTNWFYSFDKWKYPCTFLLRSIGSIGLTSAILYILLFQTVGLTVRYRQRST